MAVPLMRIGAVAAMLAALCVASLAGAQDIGQIKAAKGEVTIERGGQALPGPVGTRLQAADVVKTGADGSVGITMDDDSLLSAGSRQRALARPLCVRSDHQPGPVRRVAEQGHARGHLRPHRQAARATR